MQVIPQNRRHGGRMKGKTICRGGREEQGAAALRGTLPPGSAPLQPSRASVFFLPSDPFLPGSSFTVNTRGVAVLCAEIAASFLSSSAAASALPAAPLLNNPNPPILGVGNPSLGAGLLGSSLSLLSSGDEAACWLCFAVPLPQLLLHQCSSCSFLQHLVPISLSHTQCEPPEKCRRNLGFLLKEMLWFSCLGKGSCRIVPRHQGCPLPLTKGQGTGSLHRGPRLQGAGQLPPP